MKLSKEEAQALVWGDSPHQVIKTWVTGNGRWSVYKTIVFRSEDNGQLYGVDYSVGATEYQDEEPFQYQNEVDCYEVVEQLVPTYVRKTDGGPK